MLSDTAPSVIPANILSTIRGVLYGLAGVFVSKGSITADQSDLAVSAGLAIVALAWSFIANKRKNNALKDAIAAPTGQAKP